jgi:hypothetical protein
MSRKSNNSTQQSSKRSHDETISAERPCIEINGKGLPEINEFNLGLETFVSPISPHDFMNTFFRKKALCIHSDNGTGRISKLVGESYSSLDINTLFKTTSSDNVFIWLGKKKSIINESASSSSTKKKVIIPPLQSVEIEDADTATALHNAGHAAYCRAPLPLDRKFVDSFLKDTGLGLG